MLRIADEYVSAVAGAKSGADLQPLVKAAIQLEFATIPPYLTAMLSLAPGIGVRTSMTPLDTDLAPLYGTRLPVGVMGYAQLRPAALTTRGKVKPKRD